MSVTAESSGSSFPAGYDHFIKVETEYCMTNVWYARVKSQTEAEEQVEDITFELEEMQTYVCMAI